MIAVSEQAGGWGGVGRDVWGLFFEVSPPFGGANKRVFKSPDSQN